MLVPWLSEVYPIEDLIYNNRNSGKRTRQMVLHVEEYDCEDIFHFSPPTGRANRFGLNRPSSTVLSGFISKIA